MQKCIIYRAIVICILLMYCIVGKAHCVTTKIIYVDPNAPGLRDGTSWENAYNFLQDALSDANSTAKPVEVRVAQGVYQPDRDLSNPNGTDDKGAVFRLNNNVRLKGGYAGIMKSDPNSRDIKLYISNLSGDLDGNDSSGPNLGDNSECVIDSSGVDCTAVLDGFVITGSAYFRGEPRPGSNGEWSLTIGGGLRNISGSPEVINCTFQDNYGEVYISEESNPVFINCSFMGNFGYQGGAMTILDSEVEIMSCVFKDNEGMDSGAILAKHSGLVVTESNFSSNQEQAIVASDRYVKLFDCTFIENIGGGVSVGGSEVIIKNCLFKRNRSQWHAGAIAVITPHLTLSKCKFLSNSSVMQGGALVIWTDTINASINDCVFAGNTSADGGAILNQARNLEIKGCAIIGNRTARIGHMSALSYELQRGKGGAIFDEAGESLHIVNCTFAGNTAMHGASVWSNTSVTVENSIIWDVNAIVDSGNNNLDITFTDNLDDLPGEGNVSIDPCFVQEGLWDVNGTPEDANDDFWVDGDYHLKSQAGRWDADSQTWVQDGVTSPCIDAGDPASPIGYEPFPNGGIINMGAYGGTTEASKSWFGGPVCETIVAGDINGDCVVDFRDFVILAAHWLE